MVPIATVSTFIVLSTSRAQTYNAAITSFGAPKLYVRALEVSRSSVGGECQCGAISGAKGALVEGLRMTGRNHERWSGPTRVLRIRKVSEGGGTRVLERSSGYWGHSLPWSGCCAIGYTEAASWLGRTFCELFMCDRQKYEFLPQVSKFLRQAKW